MMIPGAAVAMGGRDWLIPPLTLGQLRRLMPKVRQLSDIGATMGENEIDVMVEIVTTALQRNYPELSPQEVEDLLDLGNAAAVLNAVLTGSGLKPAGTLAGELAAPGADPGASPKFPSAAPSPMRGPGSNGETFTGSSPPPAATLIAK
jgi:hypothetical protein